MIKGDLCHNFVMKKLFELNPIRFIIICLGIALLIVSFPAFILKDGNLHELSMHLFVELLILALTLFLLQPILDAVKENKWRIKNKSITEDLTTFSNMAITYMVNPLDIQVFNYVHNLDELDDNAKKPIMAMIKDVANQDIESLLLSLDKQKWENLRNNVLLIRQRLENTMLLYKDHMPTELLSSLLTLRLKFVHIDDRIGLFDGIFLYKESDWGERLGRRKNLYEECCEYIANDMKEYAVALKDFVQKKENYEK